MSLQHGLKQGMQFWHDLYNKVLGDCCEFAHLPGTLMQCLQLQQDMALQLLQWLQTVALACCGCLGVWLVHVALQEQDINATAGYPGLYP